MSAFPETIAILGAGAVGGFYGAKLARTGADVRFLMRSDLAAVKRSGLQVREDDAQWTLSNVSAAGSSAEIGAVDLVIIGLKATGNAALETLLPPLLHGNTRLLTLQNGLGNEEFLAARWGAERVLGGLCFVCLNRTAAGVIEHYGKGTLSLGEFGATRPERATDVRQIGAQFSHAGVKTQVVDNLAEERWRKLVWNIPFNGLSIALGGRTCDQLLADEDSRRQVRALMVETIAAANALGFVIPENFADFQIQRTLPMGAYRPSSMIDWQLGRPVEVEAIWGEPWRRAGAAGMAMPGLEQLYETLRKVTAP